MKKLLVTLLCVNLMFIGFSSSTSASKKNEVSPANHILVNDNENTPSNMKWIEQTDEFLKYTYTLDGVNYLIEETFHDDNSVTSKVYKEDEITGEYEVVDTLKSSFDESKEVIVQENQEGIISELEVNSEEVETIYNPIDALSVSNSDNFTTQADQDFVYSSTSYGSNKPAQWLVGVIAITISTILKRKVDQWVTRVAGLTYAFWSERVYYKYVTYKKNYGQITQVTRTFRYVYSDSARTNPIANTVHDSSRTGITFVSQRIY
ncbi:hypothetical protein [Jeotgalibacillus haloalkalitolerans]|uniref:Uncharacterized protein n=1 Tax=Jeotgalibacillus haloalkalitolerans TaxID=3104292 RepID=A0ABU5KRW3_9BACL|nr:hypothetical protein [Jeotgalibacillus sp. HH7-29]MDZ5713551.1 hypothetical protein [Jeotgalibacillus sp. HH7-29]